MKWESDTSLCKNSAFAANSNLNIKKMRYTVLLYSITHLKVKGHTSYKKYHVFCEVTISIPLLLSVIHKNIFCFNVNLLLFDVCLAEAVGFNRSWQNKKL